MATATATPTPTPTPLPGEVPLIELGGVTVVVLRDCQPDLTLCDVWVLTGSFTEIATDVTVLRAFATPPSLSQPVGAYLQWDAIGNGHPDCGTILIDRNRDGDFGEPREIRVFGKD